MPAHVRVHDYPNDKGVMLARHLNFLVAKSLGCGINRVERVMWAFWESITEAILQGESVHIDGFGTFTIKLVAGKPRPTFMPDREFIRRIRAGA